MEIPRYKIIQEKLKWWLILRVKARRTQECYVFEFACGNGKNMGEDLSLQ